MMYGAEKGFGAERGVGGDGEKGRWVGGMEGVKEEVKGAEGGLGCDRAVGGGEQGAMGGWGCVCEDGEVGTAPGVLMAPTIHLVFC